jgi:hypothetical protein
VGENGFVTALYANNRNAYLYTIMGRQAFENYILERGYKIEDRRKRRPGVTVINFGTFYLYDYLLLI